MVNRISPPAAVRPPDVAANTSSLITRPPAPAVVKPFERAYDAIDAATEHAFVDLHDDAALHNLALDGNGHPHIPMRIWQTGVNIVGQFDHGLRNFHRHVTDATLNHTPKSLQVFTAVSKGFPIVPTMSHKAYTYVVADWERGADANALIAVISQAGWAYAQVKAHPENYVLASDWRGVLDAFQKNKVVVQLGIEGAFPFEASERNLQQLRAFFADPHNGLPEDFPRPTDDELKDKVGLMIHFARIGEQYISLPHLVSSCFGGTSLWPASKARKHRRAQSPRPRARARGGQQSRRDDFDLAHASPARLRLAVVGMVDADEYTLPLNVSHGLFKLPKQQRDRIAFTRHQKC